MAVWLVRAGKHGEAETIALDENLAVIGWGELPDLSGIRSREQMENLYKQIHPELTTNQLANSVGQVWAFRGRIAVGDLVILPLKTRSAIAIGRVTGGYEYRPNLPEHARHVRPVEWIRTDIPRDAFAQDILYSLGAFMTVCQIQRNDAERRIRAVLEGGSKESDVIITPDTDEDAGDHVVDIETYAGDQIRQYINRRFKGHDLARLVDALLKSQGYRTHMSPPGPDGGVDIVAGAGHLGFDSPRLCVQVKSGDTPADVGVLRQFRTTVNDFGASHGLLVSWGGFNGAVLKEAKQKYFEIRLWDAGDLVEALLREYDSLSPDIQAELPLKQTWILVQGE